MTLALIAQQSPELLEFINYGVLGLLVVAMIFDKIIPGPSHQRVIDDANTKAEEIQKLRDEIKELNAYIAEHVVPALVRATDTQAQALQLHSRSEGVGGRSSA